MSWRDLLQSSEKEITLPWTSGRSLQTVNRSYFIIGKLPEEEGWYKFNIKSDKRASELRLVGQTDPDSSILSMGVTGYLVGDRIVPDDVFVNPDPAKICEQASAVHLIEPGLDRFVRISAGSISRDSPLIYKAMCMPLGPESDVLQAFLDNLESVDQVIGVVPALDAAFRMEVWQRKEAEKRRLELERIRREEEEKRQLEERRQQIIEQLGDGAGRRAMAAIDFAEAARAALAIGGATYLDHRRAVRRDEMIVKFRLNNRRFECTCDKNTLRIIDSGVCLTAHYDDPDFDTGTKGDNFFTLESLPGVINEANREGKLVVFRHID